jgi:hypothetical protein
MKAKKKLTPIEADGFNKVCKLPRHNIDYRGFWMLTDGHKVTLAEQAVGEKLKQSIDVPKKTFDAFVRWYMTGSTKKRR